MMRVPLLLQRNERFGGGAHVQQEKKALALEIKTQWDQYRLRDYQDIPDTQHVIKFPQ